ncbi:MAG: acyl carrier protein [Verrucomicrobiales bacterium]
MSDDAVAALKRQIKEAMVEELMLQQPPEEIGDDVALFAPTGLGLDSVDALQLVVALEKRFGLKISDAEAAKGILRDVNSMAAAVQAHKIGSDTVGMR